MTQKTKYYMGTGTLEQARTLTLDKVTNVNTANWLVLPGSDEELVPIVRGLRDGDIKFGVYNFEKLEAEHMIKARSNFDLGFYDNPATTHGLHLKPDVDFDLLRSGQVFEQQNIGSVHLRYSGKVVKPPPEDICLDGWAQMDWFNGMVRYSMFTDNRSKEQLLYPRRNPPTNIRRMIDEGWIDAIGEGFTLVAWVAHFRRKDKDTGQVVNAFLQSFVDQWGLSTVKKRLADRETKIHNKVVHNNKMLPVIMKARNASVDQETGEILPSNAPTIPVFRGDVVDMATLSAGDYGVAIDGKPEGYTYEFNPDDEVTCRVWSGYADEGYAIIL